MKKSLQFLGLLVGAALLVGNSHAQSGELSYSYIEGGLSVLDVDDGGREEGFNIRGSVDFNNGIYFIGAWDRIDGPADDLDLFKLGLGFHSPINANTDWFVEGSYFRADLDSVEADDARLDFGLRSAFNNNVEGRIFAGYLFPDSDEYLVGGDLLFKVSDQFGVSVGAETIEFDLHFFKVNLRLSY